MNQSIIQVFAPACRRQVDSRLPATCGARFWNMAGGFIRGGSGGFSLGKFRCTTHVPHFKDIHHEQHDSSGR
jgi:hypothetical protein